MLKSDIVRKNVPHTPGIYLFKNKSGGILYIGKAKNIKKRLQQYFSPRSLWKQEMINKSHHVDIVETTTEEDAILLETNLILEHRPLYNNLIKGDNAYVYIKIPKEPFPRILLTRWKKNDGAIYIGPKVWKKQLKQQLQIMRSLLKRRSCSLHTFKAGKVCSDYFFGLCEGRCAYKKSDISKEIHQKIGFVQKYSIDEAKQKYKEIIQAISNFFQGNTYDIEQHIRKDIDQAVREKNFERAAKLKDIYFHLIEVSNEQHIYLSKKKRGIFVYCFLNNTEVVWSILKIYNGKIIDIITGKEEGNFKTQLELIQREYQITFHSIEENGKECIASNLIPKKISKKETKILQEQCVYALDSFMKKHQKTHHEQQNILLKQLQERYHFPFFPYTIECTDISHFGGDRTVGSIIVAQGGILNTSLRKRYKIHHTNTGDDYEALEELIGKRFAKIPSTRPDLFIIDGGKGQLQVIKKLEKTNPKLWGKIQKKTHFISLGKGQARNKRGRGVGKGVKEYIYAFDTSGNIVSLGLSYDLVDRILLKLRDEAHRFANKYRKKRMQQEYTTNSHTK